MARPDIADTGISLLKKAGADEAQCVITETQKHEISSMADEMSLLRTIKNTELRMLAVREKRQGLVVLNSPDIGVLRQSAERVLEAAAASPQDLAYGVSEMQPEAYFKRGEQSPDLERMHFRLSEFMRDAKKFPGLKLGGVGVDFTLEKKVLLNSKGVRFSSSIGTYNFYAEFSSRAGAKSSSINFCSISLKTLGRPLLRCGSVALMLQQSGQSVQARPISGKFCGDILVSPECLSSFLHFITEQALRDSMIIGGTSVYQGKLGKKVAGAGFTLRSMPTSVEVPAGYFITPDGYKAGDSTVVEKGILKSFILSRYGAAKTGFPRASNSGGCYAVEKGVQDYNSMIKAVKRGLLVTRFSGGGPNEAGDFSGIAKNSFYIENGKIKFPVSETMISGNIPRMLLGIKGISKERINLGHSIYPWIAFGGVNISGK